MNIGRGFDMREIRFRAWDRTRNKILEVHDLQTINNEVSVSNMYHNVGCYLKRDDFVLMQYTGLKDNNGVEIYEGDIVKCKYGWLGFVVYRGSGYWCEEIVTKRLNSHAPIFTTWDELEVIDNIYETPELLKSSD